MANISLRRYPNEIQRQSIWEGNQSPYRIVPKGTCRGSLKQDKHNYATYFYKRNNFQRNRSQVQRIHYKIHQIPPVVNIILQSTVPHLFNFAPDKPCKYIEKKKIPLTIVGYIAIIVALAIGYFSFC